MRYRTLVFIVAGSIVGAHAARAQDPPPPIPRFVVDLHATVPMFPNDLQQLADSRGVSVGELPGTGFGGQVGVHVYLLKWKALTLGLGGEVMLARASSTPPDVTPPSPLRPVAERLTSAAPQVSFNFGTGHGWSYLSAGIGRSQWSLHPSAESPGTADAEVLPTVNYGGGARWFIKTHLAFSLDIRLYEVQPGSSGSPRARLLTIGAGISVK